MKLGKAIRASIADEKDDAKGYKGLAKNKGLTKSEKITIKGIARDERDHKKKLTKISKRVSSR